MTFDHAVIGWLPAFALTEVVEVPIYRGILGCSVSTAFAASALTHPIVWFVFPQLRAALGFGYATMVVLAETFAVLGEAAWFRWRLKNGRPVLLASLVANGTSLGVGLLVRALFGLT